MDHWFQVEVGRTPSVQCHNEKVADVCSTEYKDTTVGAVFSPTHNVSLEKVKRCKPVERLETQQVCQKVPHRVCRQVMSKISTSCNINSVLLRCTSHLGVD